MLIIINVLRSPSPVLLLIMGREWDVVLVLELYRSLCDIERGRFPDRSSNTLRLLC
jgi:hypothetical protein